MVELLTETRKLGSAWAQFDAYWAQPMQAIRDAPGLIVVHTILGLTEHERALARTFASLGFVSVAPDLYSHQRMQVPAEDAREVERILRDVPFGSDRTFVHGFEESIATLSRQDQERLRKAARVAVYSPDPNALSDLKVCVATLRATPGVDHENIACLGMSMGGGYAWTLATVEPNVKATVIFYGRPLLPYDQLDRLKGAVLAIHAGEDTRLTDLLPELEAEMSSRGRSFTHITYPKVHHGFLNPDARTYHQGCARDALFQVLSFLRESEGALPKEAEAALTGRKLPAEAAPPARTPAPATEEALSQETAPSAAEPAAVAGEAAATDLGPSPEEEKEEAVEEPPVEEGTEEQQTDPSQGVPSSDEPVEEEATEVVQASVEESSEGAEPSAEEATEGPAPPTSGPEPTSTTVTAAPPPAEAPAPPEEEGAAEDEATVSEEASAAPSPPPQADIAEPTSEEPEVEAPPSETLAALRRSKTRAEVSAADVELLLKGHVPLGSARRSGGALSPSGKSGKGGAAPRSSPSKEEKARPVPSKEQEREKAKARERERERERQKERELEKKRREEARLKEAARAREHERQAAAEREEEKARQRARAAREKERERVKELEAQKARAREAAKARPSLHEKGNQKPRPRSGASAKPKPPQKGKGPSRKAK